MKHDEVRENVALAYGDALERSKQEKGGSGITALAGYSEAEQENFSDASASSFGCGNPLAFAGVTAGQTVVDLGSGAGLDLLIAADKVGAGGRVIGVDMTDDMIDAARQAAADAGRDNVEVRKGLIEELPVDDGAADWVISNCVINLSPDKPAVFREIHRVLRPGGRFSISDIVVEELPGWIRRSAEAYMACVAGAISEEEYLAGLRAAGLEEVAVRDRLVYDAAQIRGFIEEEMSAGALVKTMLGPAIRAVEGKVWSAKFTGRKTA